MSAPTAVAPRPEPPTPDAEPRLSPDAPRPRRRRPWLWLVGLVVVLGLIALTVALFSSAASSNRADDPRSVLPTGTAALAQLLSDEGVRIVPVDTVQRAVDLAGPGATLVVANPDRLRAEEGRRLMATRPGRLIVLRPTTSGLRAFGAAATTSTAADAVVAPGCTEAAAARAGAIQLVDARAVYRSQAQSSLRCYPVGGGAAWVRTGGVAGSLDLVAGGVSNADLGSEGNAAFAMNVFGSQQTVVWLMAERQSTGGERPSRPGLLPSWWAIGVVQLVLALVVVGIWQGRRLGPIMVEPLPVKVRSSETVIGHGRLYFRIGARERAAEALRAGVRDRLGRRFGHLHDPDALTAALAQESGRPTQQVWQLVYGPAPATDDELTALARALDELEQEVHR